jgi:hypothetical protein
MSGNISPVNHLTSKLYSSRLGTNLESGIWNLESGIWNLESGFQGQKFDSIKQLHGGSLLQALAHMEASNEHCDVTMLYTRRYARQ